MTRDPYLFRYPRTVQEAFPCDAGSACAVTCYRAPIWPRLLLWAFLLIGALAVAFRFM